uniref:DNA sulfur modification protein DndD n=1 Tax=Luteolibacter marinus TaxID=2776705 RepID=UPI001869007D
GSGGDPAALEAAAKADAEVERLEREAEDLTHKRAKCDTRLKELKDEKERLETQFQRSGGDLFLRRKELDSLQADLQRKVTAEEEALRHLAAGVAPLQMLGDLLGATQKALEHDGKVKRERVLVESLEARDRQLIEYLRKSRLPAKQLDLASEWLSEDLKNHQKVAKEKILLDAEDTLLGEIRHLRSQSLPKSADDVCRHQERLADYRRDLERIERELGKVPSEDSIATLQIELKSARERLAEAELLLGSLATQLEVTGRQITEAKKRADQASRRVAELGLDDEDTERVLRFSQRTRDTLVQFREAMTRKHVSRIESLMLESFMQLLRKQSLVRGLSIDPVSFEISLTGGDGLPLPFDRLSAGERQLLATSLLWGLARASGRPIPTVIDTPLGRLDSSHRKHLVERYFPVAAHQVILLSTDEEIHETNLARLRPSIARSYQLVHDEQLRRTRIEPGYFWNHEAAR